MAGDYFNVWDQFGLPSDSGFAPYASGQGGASLPVVPLVAAKNKSAKKKLLTMAMAPQEAAPQTPPQTMPNYDDLLLEYRNKSGDQNAALKQYLNNTLETQKADAARNTYTDLSPAMAWFDSQFGSNLQRGYTKPESAEEIQAKADQYNQAVNQARLGLPKQDLENLKTQLDYMYKKEQGMRDAELKEDALALQGQKLAKSSGRPSKFFDTLNVNIAKQAGEYLGGGKAEAESNIGIVRDAALQLKNNPALTGPGKGTIPLKGIFLSETKALQDKMATAVQGSLRPILGAQFTEAEGRRIVEQALDVNLSAEENSYRINRLLKKIEAAKAEKEAAIEYAAKNGSLEGYPRLNNLSSKADFENQNWSEGYKGSSASESNASVPGEEKAAALKWAKENPGEKANQILKALGEK